MQNFSSAMLVLVIVFCNAALAQALMLTAPNANVNSPGSVSSRGVASGGKLYYSANGELYCTDGTAAGTYCVRDIRLGPASSMPENITAYNNGVLFTADDGVYGRELWRSDGTGAGTQLVKDVFANQMISSFISPMVEYNGFVYFTANDGIKGRELWRTDGTTAGTTVFKELNPGTGSGAQSFLAVANGLLFFTGAISTTDDFELWKSDGTVNGTTQVKDLISDTNNLVISALYGAGPTLYFVLSDNSVIQLWKSDGTQAGTVMVGEIADYIDSSISSFTAYNGKLYFIVNDGINGHELWCSNGTASGTGIIKDINPGSSSGLNSNSALAGAGSKLLFAATDGVDGTELWSTDGTAAGTSLLKNIAVVGGSEPIGFFSLGSYVYFSADDNINGIQLWKSDGDSIGTTLVKAIPNNSVLPTNFSALAGVLFYSAVTIENGSELWRSDGTEAGTFMVVDTNTANGTNPSPVTEIGSKLLFSATDPAHGAELWISDGTVAGTGFFRDIFAGIQSSDISIFQQVGGTVVFSAIDGVSGKELWKSDGTFGGTVQAADLSPGPTHSVILSPVTVNSGLAVFSAFANGLGYELWRTDGQSVSLVKDINPSGNSSPSNLVNLNGTIYFSASDGVNGTELWKSDGTSQGTHLVIDIVPGSASSGPNHLTVVNDVIYFTADFDTELWKTDGTSAGTVFIKRFPNVISRLCSGGNYLYFRADDFVGGVELWRSDGTENGTAIVKDLTGDGFGSNPDNLAWVNGLLFFTADVNALGRELWVTDGTSAGTRLVKDIVPGDLSSGISGITAYPQKGIIIFAAGDDAYGVELWASDGTNSGTQLIYDIAPGGASSMPQSFRITSTGIYFSANDNTNGRQLWKIDFNDFGPDLPTVSISDAFKTEGNAGNSTMMFDVILSTASSKTVVCNYSTQDTSAIAGTDYLSVIGVVTFPPGQTVQSVPVTILGNLLDQDDRTFQLKILVSSNALIADAVADGLIQDDDLEPTLSINATSIFEGNVSGTTTPCVVSLSAPSGKLVTVKVRSQDDTAIANIDYLPINGATITFAPGEISKTIGFTTLGDFTDEVDEAVFLNLTNATNAQVTQPQVKATIIDDDSAGIVITPTTLSAVEGLPGKSFTVRLTSVPTSNVTVSFNNVDLSEVILSQDSITFLSDASSLQEQIIIVTGVEDNLTDGDVTFQIQTSITSSDSTYSSQQSQVITITNLENRPPDILSGISLTPSVVTVGRPVTFIFAVADQENQPIQISFDYGDGTTGTSSQHTYAAPLVYSVILSASDGKSTVTSSAQVVVLSVDHPDADPDGDNLANTIDYDDDGDGFSDEFEISVATDQFSEQSTPGGALPGTLMPLVITKLGIKLNFATTGKDSIQLSGVLPIPEGLTVNGSKFLVDTGGVVGAFTLDSKGKSPKADSSVALRLRTKKGVVNAQNATFSLKAKNGSFSTMLADEGLTNVSIKGAQRTVRVTLVFNGAAYLTDQMQIYNAVTGKTGLTKSPR